MRYVLAAIFVCALGMPVASALPTISADAVSASKADPTLQVAKRNKSVRASRQSNSANSSNSANNSGIHPLVGSGDY